MTLFRRINNIFDSVSFAITKGQKELDKVKKPHEFMRLLTGEKWNGGLHMDVGYYAKLHANPADPSVYATIKALSSIQNSEIYEVSHGGETIDRIGVNADFIRMDAQVVTLNDMVDGDLNPMLHSDPRADHAEIRVWGDFGAMKSNFNELKDLYAMALEDSNLPDASVENLVSNLKSRIDVDGQEIHIS